MSDSSAQVEVKVEAIHVISRAEPLPFEVIDASRGDEELAAAVAKGELMVTVNRDTRLDSRPVDLRTPANQAVFQIQSGVCQVRKDIGFSGLGFSLCIPNYTDNEAQDPAFSAVGILLCSALQAFEQPVSSHRALLPQVAAAQCV